MNKIEKEQLRKLDAQLDYWGKTDKEHQAYLKAHPDKPLTKEELKWLNDYQAMTHDSKWW